MPLRCVVLRCVVGAGVTVQFSTAQGTELGHAKGQKNFGSAMYVDPSQTARGGDVIPNVVFAPGEWDWATPQSQLPPTLREYLAQAKPGEVCTVNSCRGGAAGRALYSTHSPSGVITTRDDDRLTTTTQQPLFDLTPYSQLEPKNRGQNPDATVHN